jgi:predicted DNA-binding protein YlxM (UPF0122 family)
MFEKNLNIAFLLDFYGEVLSDRKREVLDAYYNDDLSLAEIATDLGISRQGVRDLIKKAETELFFYEEKLGLAKKFREAAEHAARLRTLAQRFTLPEEIEAEIRALEESVG